MILGNDEAYLLYMDGVLGFKIGRVKFAFSVVPLIPLALTVMAARFWLPVLYAYAGLVAVALALGAPHVIRRARRSREPAGRFRMDLLHDFNGKITSMIARYVFDCAFVPLPVIAMSITAIRRHRQEAGGEPDAQ